MTVIPFYGADDPDMFAIERRAMDRDGLVIAALDAALPGGLVLDVGAGDGFSALTDDDISGDPAFWEMHGFRCEPIDTVFRFDDLEEGRSLLGFFFGDRGRERADLEIGFRVGLFTRPSHGVA